MRNIARIGYSLGPLLSVNQILQFSKLAEKNANTDSIWVPESWGRDAFVTLSAISQITKRVRLGSSIVSIFSRTPATIAMSATTLDFLSNKRTVVGLGVSTAAIVENWHGVKFTQPVERMREYLECLRLMIKGDKVNYRGKFFEIKNFKILHDPARANIPLYIAAINKRMLSLSAEADGVILYLRPLEELRKAVRTIKPKRDAFEVVSVFICAISNKNPNLARERAARTLAFYVSVGRYYSKFLAENGYKNEVDQITMEYQKSGLDNTWKYVTDKMLDSLTICGSSEDCLKSLDRFVGAGITLPVMQVNPLKGEESSIRELLAAFQCNE